MSDLIYEKAQPVQLRDVGLDERWLQDQIEEDPSILGLGDLAVLQRERKQPTGGRIDFLMYNPEDAGLRYEVEVMLGRVDESHIIRTIEYWDVERQRYPNHQHRAVIIAEDLTTRFLNVIGLLNRAIPMIAIQMSAFQLDGKLVLHFVKLLDLAVESTADEDTDSGERVDREFWVRKASADSMGAADKVLSLIPGGASPTYNKYHIAVSTTGKGFCWIYPRKQQGHIHLDALVGDAREQWNVALEEAGLRTRESVKDTKIGLRLTQREIGEHDELLQELFRHAEEESR